MRGSATQLQEAFIQLIQNARSARCRPAGGTLTLEIKRDRGQAGARDGSPTPGRGISAEHLPRIFDPFFTTKASDRSGSGLGLSFVHRIVEDHGGTIQVESTPGAGTKFVLTFPADAGQGAPRMSCAGARNIATIASSR